MNDVGKSGYLGKHRREFRHLARLVASIDHWIIVKALPCIFLNVNWLEVRNPGRLPKGMTVEKLAGEHASLPVDPLLANPVYLAGYIEQVGTGTNDVIDRCVELGLRKPEFRQDENFTVVMWRREVDGTENGVASNQVNNQVEDIRLKLTSTQNRIITFCTSPRSAQEIMDEIGVTNQYNNRQRHFVSLVEMGVLAMTQPDSPKSPTQKYYLTELGKALLENE